MFEDGEDGGVVGEVLSGEEIGSAAFLAFAGCDDQPPVVATTAFAACLVHARSLDKPALAQILRNDPASLGDLVFGNDAPEEEVSIAVQAGDEVEWWGGGVGGLHRVAGDGEGGGDVDGQGPR